MNKTKFLEQNWKEVVEKYESKKLSSNGYIIKKVTAKDILL